MFLLTPFTFVYNIIYTLWMDTTLYDGSTVYNIIRSVFWFRNCFFLLYIFVYMQKNSAQISLNTTNSKNFSHRIYIYLVHHGYVALCASCMQACITPDTRTPFSISCYIIQSFGFIFPFPNRQPTYTI